jgi:hypothetical protein
MAKHPPASVNLLVRSWRRTPQFIKWIGYVGSISGTIYALSQVLPIIEPGFPAHRAYARSVSHDDVAPLLKRVVAMQLVQNDARRKRLLKSVKDYELELDSDQAKKTPQYHKLVQDGIERAKHELKDIDDDDTNLFKEKK